MKTQAYQFDDNKYGSLRKTEDAYKVHKNTICVADGITRDPVNIVDFAGSSMEELLKDYPNPSPALQAAELFCDSFIKNIGNRQDVQSAFIAGNLEIKMLNHNRSIDYLANDYAACVAAGTFIDDLKLYWASIGDCFVAVFNSIGICKFQSPHGTLNWEQYEKANPGNWSDPSYRRKVRSEFRNNPHQFVNGNLVAYGALTGEQTAEQFVVHGLEDLAKEDVVVCFSDGFLHIVNHPDFYEKLVSKQDDFTDWQQSLAELDYSKYGHERTLVVQSV